MVKEKLLVDLYGDMKMNKPIFISFYTKSTIYEDALNKYLIPSLKKLKLEYHIYDIETLGDWKSNAIQKPIILQRALNDFPDRDIIWQDVDSEILQAPSLLFNIPEEYDIALHYLNWETHYGRPNDKGKFELLDGTVLWRNTDKIKDFILHLIKDSTEKGIDHQKTMAEMLKVNKAFNIFPLPRTYSYLLSQPNGDKPVIEIKNPTIIHHQMSRQAKQSLYEKI